MVKSAPITAAGAPIQTRISFFIVSRAAIFPISKSEAATPFVRGLPQAEQKLSLSAAGCWQEGQLDITKALSKRRGNLPRAGRLTLERGNFNKFGVFPVRSSGGA